MLQILKKPNLLKFHLMLKNQFIQDFCKIILNYQIL